MKRFPLWLTSSCNSLPCCYHLLLCTYILISLSSCWSCVCRYQWEECSPGSFGSGSRWILWDDNFHNGEEWLTTLKLLSAIDHLHGPSNLNHQCWPSTIIVDPQPSMFTLSHQCWPSTINVHPQPSMLTLNHQCWPSTISVDPQPSRLTLTINVVPNHQCWPKHQY